MKTKINVAEILKYKPQGTKLYDLLRNIDVELDKVHTTDVGTYIKCTPTNEVGSTLLFDYSKLGTEEGYLDGLQILLPSKKMRDWRKFDWKKGDVLVSKDNVYIIFEKFENDSYTTFKGKHYFWKELDEEDYSKEEAQRLTSLYEKANNDDAQTYIKTIEEKLGGILNRETLEIEKTQPEFKDGDVLFVTCRGDDYIEIFNYSKVNGDLYDHASLDTRTQELNFSGEYKIYKDSILEIRLATEEEKQQLFSALAKEGKAWDAEKKQIVDLKPEVELKPFDKVLVRDNSKQKWIPDMYRFYDKDEEFPYNCFSSTYKRCIPYNEDTKHLLGTTDEWKGGEG